MRNFNFSTKHNYTQVALELKEKYNLSFTNDEIAKASQNHIIEICHIDLLELVVNYFQEYQQNKIKFIVQIKRSISIHDKVISLCCAKLIGECIMELAYVSSERWPDVYELSIKSHILYKE